MATLRTEESGRVVEGWPFWGGKGCKEFDSYLIYQSKEKVRPA